MFEGTSRSTMVVSPREKMSPGPPRGDGLSPAGRAGMSLSRTFPSDTARVKPRESKVTQSTERGMGIFFWAVWLRLNNILRYRAIGKAHWTIEIISGKDDTSRPGKKRTASILNWKNFIILKEKRAIAKQPLKKSINPARFFIPVFTSLA
jgi:hypothetical protein